MSYPPCGVPKSSSTTCSACLACSSISIGQRNRDSLENSDPRVAWLITPLRSHRFPSQANVDDSKLNRHHPIFGQPATNSIPRHRHDGPRVTFPARAYPKNTSLKYLADGTLSYGHVMLLLDPSNRLHPGCNVATQPLNRILSSACLRPSSKSFRYAPMASSCSRKHRLVLAAPVTTFPRDR